MGIVWETLLFLVLSGYLPVFGDAGFGSLEFATAWPIYFSGIVFSGVCFVLEDAPRDCSFRK